MIRRYMLMALAIIVSAAMWISALAKGGLPVCAALPEHLRIELPQEGFVELNSEVDSDACGWRADGESVRMGSRGATLSVHADGPSGRGRYWLITLAVGASMESVPQRGICL